MTLNQKHNLSLLGILVILGSCLATLPIFADEKDVESNADEGTNKRTVELDAYWKEVSRAVGSGDFERYKSTCHEEGVLVSGSTKKSQPLAEALERWKADFEKTKSGKIKAGVEFRFAQRLGDQTTAHETGMFRYWTKGDDGVEKSEFIHFEALLVKRKDGWKILMEYQKSKGTEAEWKALASE